MTIVAVGFVPAAPLLVPEVAGGSAATDEQMRTASVEVVRALVEREPDTVVVLAASDKTETWDESTRWEFHGFGVPRADTRSSALPWPLGIGAWLLDAIAFPGARRYVPVPSAAEGIASSMPTGRISVLAVGDGSARRDEKAPGHFDERAADFDASIAAALETGDAVALTALDPAVGVELMCSGLPVWQVLAGCLDNHVVISANLRYAAAPYGVGYAVASWLVEPANGGNSSRSMS